MSAPIVRSSGRGQPVSPARSVPLVGGRSLVVQSQAQAQSAQGYYQADAWTSLPSNSIGPSGAPLSSHYPAVRAQNRGLNIGGYAHNRAQAMHSGPSYVELRGSYETGSPLGSFTAMTMPSAASGSQMSLGAAVGLTSPRCESPTKAAAPSSAPVRPRFAAVPRGYSDISADVLMPLTTTYSSSREDGVMHDAVEVSRRGGLAARAAASLQPRAVVRRGSSVDAGPRAGRGAVERSYSAHPLSCHSEGGVQVRIATARTCASASSLSALPSLSHAEALSTRGSGTADSGSSTVPLPLGPPQYLSGAHGAPRSVLSAGASGGNCSVAREPEAEPAARLSPLVAAELARSINEGPGGLPVVVQGGEIDNIMEDGHLRGDSLQEFSYGSEEYFQSAKVTLNTALVELDDCNPHQGNMNLRVCIMPSEVIGWHELNISQVISKGSFGEVYLARYRGKEVSVKRCILRHDGSMTKEQLHNLEREINTYRTLNHPSIVKYIGCVLEHPNLAIVTEYVPNGNVFDLLFTHRVDLPAAIRLKIASQVALALNYMHSCDPIVIHRDLKTQNLVLDVDYSVKLCDFGKTQPMEEDSALPLGQDNGGSPRYMAPECFQGFFITEKVDIWSLGCCLVEVLGGPLPYEDVPLMSEVMHLILHHHQPPLVPQWFAPEVRPMLAGCFDFEPQLRIPISEVQLALRRLTPEQMERHGMDKRRCH